MYMHWFTYILLCSDDSYYVGHTEDIEARLALHNAGKGAVHTAHRRPVTLIYLEPYPSKAQEIAREKQLKKWTRAKKQALVNKDLDRLHDLAMRRQK
jgi:predicted GIY-YIG superfamily endonuclease